MPRIRSAKNKNLPPYVRKRSSGYYLEPKSKMRELLGGKSSYPLGNSLSEMYCAYAKYMGALESRKKQSLYTMNDLFQKYIEKELHDNCKEHVKRMRTKLGFLIASFGLLADGLAYVCAYVLMYLLTYLLTCLPTYLRAYSLTYLFTYVFTC